MPSIELLRGQLPPKKTEPYQAYARCCTTFAHQVKLLFYMNCHNKKVVLQSFYHYKNTLQRQFSFWVTQKVNIIKIDAKNQVCVFHWLQSFLLWSTKPNIIWMYIFARKKSTIELTILLILKISSTPLFTYVES